MQVFHSSKSAGRALKGASAVTLGNFDGVHLGHRAILAELKQVAHRKHLWAVACTFDPHPAQLLAPHAAPPSLNTLEQKIALFREAKLDALIIEPFTHRFAQKSPEGFFRGNLIQHLRAALVMVGYDFTFGAKRAGNVETLERLCFKAGMECRIISPQMSGNTLVSSTVIRQFVRDGRLREVMPLLGRPFFVKGVVIPGEQRGRELGFPTVNLDVPDQLIPQDGVYLCRVELGKKDLLGLTNIGSRPTFGHGSPRSLETHLLDYQSRAYGKVVTVYFLDRLRDERKFSLAQQLIQQIQRDVTRGRALYKKMAQQKKWSPYLKWSLRSFRVPP